ncbi:MAG: aspartate-semialdehyde dehydrogenase [Verrucomicrobiota bacterium JB022]|nr:aspartate-semialdehyde dehydrogenase [Verrucomicrobiota bacterium JB022]
MAYRVGIVGATGAVGQEFIRLLNERNFPMSELRLFASARSAGKTVTFGKHTYTVEETTPEIFRELDLALFSAGGDISEKFGPIAVEAGCVVVDNSSAFRMDPSVPLVVPEINSHALAEHTGIIANPNCSTAITLMGLYPLHQKFKLRRFTAATYQATSGSGVEGMEELDQQVKSHAKGEELKVEHYPYQIAFNLIPQVDKFTDNGYTKEELKMLNESRKIMGLGDLACSVTCVRVPVFRAHSIAVNAEFFEPVDLEEARQAIRDFAGVELFDEPNAKQYPMPLRYSGMNDCGVGRLRKDTAFENGLAFWVVGDQLLKGAALNAVQIAEELHKLDMLRVPAKA